MTPQRKAWIVRGLKVAGCEAALAVIAAVASYFQTSGKELVDASTFALIVSVGTPIVAAAEKKIHWFEDQPIS